MEYRCPTRTKLVMGHGSFIYFMNVWGPSISRKILPVILNLIAMIFDRNVMINSNRDFEETYIPFLAISSIPVDDQYHYIIFYNLQIIWLLLSIDLDTLITSLPKTSAPYLWIWPSYLVTINSGPSISRKILPVILNLIAMIFDRNVMINSNRDFEETYIPFLAISSIPVDDQYHYIIFYNLQIIWLLLSIDLDT